METKIARLREICTKQQAMGAEELEERNALLRYLRKEGFDSKEMPILVAGKLMVDTIRKIVAGVQVSESALRNRIAAVLVEMARNDLHFGDVQKATEITKLLASKHVELEDVSTLVDQCTKEGVDPKSVVDSFKERKRLGISISQLTEGLAWKKELEGMGLQQADLRRISEIAGKNGRQAGKVLDSVSAYDGLEAVNHDMRQVREDLEKVKLVLEKSRLEAKKIEVDTVHLQPVLGMCKKLLYKHHFTTAAIQSVFIIARKYGKPFEVIQALESYGDMKALKKNVRLLTKKEVQLASNIAEKELRIAALQGQQESIGTALMMVLPRIQVRLQGIEDKLQAIDEQISSSPAQNEKFVREYLDHLDR